MTQPAHTRPAPARAVRVLFVDDSSTDADLLRREMQRGGLSVRHKRVDDQESMTAALQHGRWDVVIADHKMPRFDVFSAFRVLQQHAPTLPFIVVSGAMHEQTAAELMRQGAHDFVAKDNLSRMVPAIERALAHSQELRGLRNQLANARHLGGVAELCRAFSEDAMAELGRVGGLAEALASDGYGGGGNADLQEVRRVLAGLRELMRPFAILGSRALVDELPADLDRVIDRAAPLLQQLAGDNVQLELPIAGGPRLPVHLDAVEAQQLVVTMLLHALERAPKGSAVIMHVGAVDAGETLDVAPDTIVAAWPYVRLAVGDAGPTMTSRQISMLLDESNDETDGLGSALLALAGRIRALGGLVWATPRPGGGMSWLTALPLAGDTL